MGEIMKNVINANMILEINRLLNDKGIEYSIHGIGGCTSCGLEVRQEGKGCSIDKIIDIINGYLKEYWIYVKINELGYLTVYSKFGGNDD